MKLKIRVFGNEPRTKELISTLEGQGCTVKKLSGGSDGAMIVLHPLPSGNGYYSIPSLLRHRPILMDLKEKVEQGFATVVCNGIGKKLIPYKTYKNLQNGLSLVQASFIITDRCATVNANPGREFLITLYKTHLAPDSSMVRLVETTHLAGNRLTERWRIGYFSCALTAAGEKASCPNCNSAQAKRACVHFQVERRS